MTQFVLRPGVTNPALWHPQRPPKGAWDKIRKAVLERDDYTCAGCGHRALKYMNIHHVADSQDDSPDNLIPVCVACHAVLHVGMNLELGVLEVWECDLNQVEVVQRSRALAAKGMTLKEIKDTFALRSGAHPPGSTNYANDLLRSMDTAPRGSLADPLTAIFVNFSRWQLE